MDPGADEASRVGWLSWFLGGLAGDTARGLVLWEVAYWEPESAKVLGRPFFTCQSFNPRFVLLRDADRFTLGSSINGGVANWRYEHAPLPFEPGDALLLVAKSAAEMAARKGRR